jgi:phasin family protein
MTEERNKSTAELTIELARGAMENYLDFFQKTMFASPWAETDLNKKIQSYAGKNLATTFEYAQKLTKAKDLQELMQIQTEFMQTQVKALSKQANDLGETATKAETEPFKGRSGSS